MRWILIVLLVCPWSLEAQRRPARKPAPAAAAPSAWPIESIAVTGNHEYSREQILGVAGLKLGQTAAAKDFDAARARLEAAGQFPKRIRLGQNRVAWLLKEVEEWLDARIAKRDANVSTDTPF